MTFRTSLRKAQIYTFDSVAKHLCCSSAIPQCRGCQ